MNIDELTQKAFDAYMAQAESEDDGAFPNCLRAAVLEVLAEVRQCVPEPQAYGAGERGFNRCRAEMLRRLDAMGAPK